MAAIAPCVPVVIPTVLAMGYSVPNLTYGSIKEERRGGQA